MFPSGDRSAGRFHQFLHFTVDNGKQNDWIISVSGRATLCTFISAAVGWWGRQVHGARNQIRSWKIHQPRQRDKLHSSVRHSCCIIKGCEVSRLFIFSGLCRRRTASFARAVSHFRDKKKKNGAWVRLPSAPWLNNGVAPLLQSPKGIMFQQ